MVKVITYGTFDLLHQGHINLLKRAKALGDYLVVGVTSDDFDVSRGKINVQQTLMERMEAVKSTGIADEVFPEEYVGQKIDDIKRNNISVFAVGTDWEGKFDYLNEYCKVVYLPRTEGISSTQLRSADTVRIGVVGEDPVIAKMKKMSTLINGIEMDAIFCGSEVAYGFKTRCEGFDDLLSVSDAVYVATRPEDRYSYIKRALESGKHVISESPVTLNKAQTKELFRLANKNGLVLFDSIKTAYSLPFSRLVLLIKTGLIGEVKSIDVHCTSLENAEWLKKTGYYTSFIGWGAFGLLPAFDILGLDYKKADIFTISTENFKDAYTKVDLLYEDKIASVSVGVGVKAESDMVIAGTNGYIYVPSPWWKSEYFEARFEDKSKSRPFYYKNDGEGLQMELLHFLKCIKSGEKNFYVSQRFSEKVSEVMQKYIGQFSKE